CLDLSEFHSVKRLICVLSDSDAGLSNSKLFKDFEEDLKLVVRTDTVPTPPLKLFYIHLSLGERYLV
ncbi:hypothetical protein M758_7G150800, partial [Ceratodon purpureus]